jgi:hypothetical protein
MAQQETVVSAIGGFFENREISDFRLQISD